MASDKKAVLLILDGLGDLPTPKTALQMAKKPNLDRLAKEGITGLMSSVGRGVVPGSDTSHLEILGYPPKQNYCGRGPLEALGVGIPLRVGDVAFRANFATVEKGMITDRRAGRIETESARKLAGLISMKIEGVEITFRHSVEHRGALVMRGPGLSPCVADTDPNALVEPYECLPTDESPEAAKTARVANEFTRRVQKLLAEAPENKARAKAGLLPANIVLLRGAGMYRKLPTLDERFGLRSACVAGGALYKGIATYLGIDVFMVPGATGDRHTDLKAKAQAAAKALSNGYNFVFIHVKATDSFGHDGDMKGKAQMIERVDKELIPELIKTGAYLVVTGDHSTPCSRKKHSAHEVPVLFWGKDERADSVDKFDEISCMDGGLGHIHGHNLMAMMLNLIERAPKFGS